MLGFIQNTILKNPKTTDLNILDGLRNAIRATITQINSETFVSSALKSSIKDIVDMNGDLTPAQKNAIDLIVDNVLRSVLDQVIRED